MRKLRKIFVPKPKQKILDEIKKSSAEDFHRLKKKFNKYFWFDIPLRYYPLELRIKREALRRNFQITWSDKIKIGDNYVLICIYNQNYININNDVDIDIFGDDEKTIMDFIESCVDKYDKEYAKST